MHATFYQALPIRGSSVPHFASSQRTRTFVGHTPRAARCDPGYQGGRAEPVRAVVSANEIPGGANHISLKNALAHKP